MNICKKIWEYFFPKTTTLQLSLEIDSYTLDREYIDKCSEGYITETKKCRWPGCHRTVLPGKVYCKKHIG